MPNFTRNAIKASFLKLLNERPLSKITVKDVVEDCGINRNSFYYHYQDIPTLLEEIVYGEVDRIMKQYPTVESFEECLKISVEFALANKKATYHIYNSVNRDSFEAYLWRICEYVVTSYIDREFEGHSVNAQDRKILIRYYKCEIFGQISDWLENGMEEDIISSSKRLFELRKGIPEELFRRCRSDNSDKN